MTSPTGPQTVNWQRRGKTGHTCTVLATRVQEELGPMCTCTDTQGHKHGQDHTRKHQGWPSVGLQDPLTPAAPTRGHKQEAAQTPSLPTSTPPSGYHNSPHSEDAARTCGGSSCRRRRRHRGLPSPLLCPRTRAPPPHARGPPRARFVRPAPPLPRTAPRGVEGVPGGGGARSARGRGGCGGRGGGGPARAARRGGAAAGPGTAWTAAR